MKRAIALVTMLASSGILFAQQIKNPVSTVIQEIVPKQQKNLVAAVEEMPADIEIVPGLSNITAPTTIR